MHRCPQARPPACCGSLLLVHSRPALSRSQLRGGGIELARVRWATPHPSTVFPANQASRAPRAPLRSQGHAQSHRHIQPARQPSPTTGSARRGRHRVTRQLAPQRTSHQLPSAPPSVLAVQQHALARDCGATYLELSACARQRRRHTQAARRHLFSHSSSQARTSTGARTRAHANACARTSARAHTHTHTHAHLHTHIHIARE